MLEKIGEIIAILEAVGLTVTAKNNCIAAPKSYLFALQFPRLVKKVAKNARLDAMMMEAINAIDVTDIENLPPTLPASDQLRVIKGYYSAKAAL